MTDELKQSKSSDQYTQKRERGQKGLHRVSVRRVKELVKAIYELGENDPVPKVLVLEHIGKKPSGNTDILIGAANTYGFTRRAGNEKLELTERGKNLINESTETYAVYEALFANEIFSALVGRYADKSLPSDKAVLLYLTQTHGLKDDDAAKFWEVTKSNLADYGLWQELSSGAKMILTREKAEANLPRVQDISASNLEDTEKITNTDEKSQVSTNIPPASVNVPVGNLATLSQVVPEFHFNIQIHIPDNASAETYDRIFKSIGTHLLGRKQE